MPSAPTSLCRSFLKGSIALLSGGFLLALPPVAKAAEDKGPLMAYVGTYSSPKPFIRHGEVALPPGNGRGIHLFQVDRATGALSPCGLYEQRTSPTCLVFNAAKTRLYSMNATDQFEGSESGSISAFAIDPADGKLTLLNTVASGGAGPTYASVDPSGRFLLVANYFGGSVAVLPIKSDGSLEPASDVHVSMGKAGPKRPANAPPGSFGISGHDQPHAHMILPDPASHFVFSADLGTDQILVWKFDDHTGILSANDPVGVSLPPGDGPRHFVLHPNGHWFYSLQEEGSTVMLFDYDSEKGRLTFRQTLSSLPPGFVGTSMASEILASPDGRFIYAANRTHDSIACFSVGAKGELTFVADEPSHGNFPRTFNFDPTGTFVYACNQRGDNIAIFRVDRDSGRLAFTGQYTAVGTPAIIVFLEVGK